MISFPKTNKDTLIFITNLSSFYKINLYNCIAKKRDILVVYTHADDPIRNADFFRGKPEFKSIQLGNFSPLKKAWILMRLVLSVPYERIIIGGWYPLVNWVPLFFSKKSKNACAVESSDFESLPRGWRGFLKRLYVKRMGRIYASGLAQKRLTDSLGFKGETIITGGVGVFNIVPQPPYAPRARVKNFLYVGRLAPEKNLELLVRVFNRLPEFTLNIVGFGPDEEKLRALAAPNVVFHGAVENKMLPRHYQENDVFILPSRSEPWGLVVEEALNNGTPVIVSNRVGCIDAVVKGNGLIFPYDDENALEACVRKMADLEFYNRLRAAIAKMDFEAIKTRQVACYER